MPKQTSRVARKWPYYVATRAISDHSGVGEQSFMPPTFSDYTTYPNMFVGPGALHRGISTSTAYGGSLYPDSCTTREDLKGLAERPRRITLVSS